MATIELKGMVGNLDSMPPWWRAGGMLIGIGAIALTFGGQTQGEDWDLPATLIVASGAVLLPTIFQVLRRSPEEVLADHFLVLACGFLVYNVFGALLIPYGPRDEAEWAMQFYWVDASLAMQVIAVNCIGLGTALVVSALVSRRAASRLAATAILLGRSFRSEWVISAFLIIGGVSSFYVLSFDLGQRDGVAHGFMRIISKLLLVAIVIAAAYRGRGANWLFLAAIVLAGLFSVSGLLTFNKSSVLLPIMALLVGLAWRIGVRRMVLPAVLVLGTLFLVIGDPITTARNIYGLRVQIDWSDRFDIMWDGMTQSTQTSRDRDYTPWARFCYLPPQGAALDLYDMGLGDDDFSRLGWVFVPRLLFPEKPDISSSVVTFDSKVSGRDLTSAAGHGVFVNGYYNNGWWGVAFVGVAVGCILAWTSAVAAQVFRARALIWLPVALQGSFIAFRIDGHFLADYWGVFALVLYAVVGGAMIQSVVSRKRAT